MDTLQYKYIPSYFTPRFSCLFLPLPVDQLNPSWYLSKDKFYQKNLTLFIHHAVSLSPSSYCKQVFSSLGGSDLAAVLTEWYCSFSASSKQLVDTETICHTHTQTHTHRHTHTNTHTPLCVISANEKWLVFLELEQEEQPCLCPADLFCVAVAVTWLQDTIIVLSVISLNTISSRLEAANKCYFHY